MSEAPVLETPVVDPPAGNPAPADPPAGNDPPVTPAAEPPAGDPPAAAPPKPFYASLPEDWRVQTAKVVAGENASEEDIGKVQKQMERFDTFEAFAKNRFDLQKKLSEGFAKSALPDDATDEQIAEWRAANGVPEAPDKYELDLGEGVTLAGEDKAILDALLPTAHGLNLPAGVMSELGKTFFEQRAKAAEARLEKDGLESRENEKQLKEHWKADAAANFNIAKSAVSQMPEGLRERFVNARMKGGKGIMNDPEFVSWFVERERAANPTVSVVPAGDGNPVQTIKDEIAELEKRMGTPEWYKDTKANARLEQLYAAEAKLAKQQN